MWGVTPVTDYDWDGLRQKVSKGMKNSLLLSLMPTATTSQILGNTEAFEPVTSNLYTRKVLAGDFPVVNQHLYRELSQRGLWTKTMVNDIIRNNGSIQSLTLPEDIKSRFRTVWEISMKTVINLAAERAPFIDQTQSMNLFIQSPSISNLTSMHFYAWKKGLKTGCYYLRTKPKTEAVKFSLMEDSAIQRFEEKKYTKNGKTYTCTEEVCTACSA
jgi:ribonucleotide reductase alpha subunit